MNSPAQTIVLASESLTQKQRDFARYYVECRSVTTAYRMAYNVSTEPGIQWIYTEAQRTLHLPHVAAYVQELQEAAAALTIVKGRDILQDLVDQASTDMNDLVQLRTVNCRHCYGTDGRYQWRDEAELAIACEEKQADVDRGVKWVKFPDALGGFGFDPRKPPSPNCVKCLGAGQVLVQFTDTDKLTPKARKLYKGAKLGTNGQVELLLHDAHASRIEVAKMLGMYGKENTLNPAEPETPVAADASEAEAATGYLEMLG